MAETENGCGTITLSRARRKFEIPSMPSCWDSQDDWEGWCRLMALTYRQDYSQSRTLQEALRNYCVDCVPGLVRDIMIRSGRCSKYTCLEPAGIG
jgi:hypothetical protein